MRVEIQYSSDRSVVVRFRDEICDEAREAMHPLQTQPMALLGIGDRVKFVAAELEPACQ